MLYLLRIPPGPPGFFRSSFSRALCMKRRPWMLDDRLCGSAVALGLGAAFAVDPKTLWPPTEAFRRLRRSVTSRLMAVDPKGAAM